MKIEMTIQELLKLATDNMTKQLGCEVEIVIKETDKSVNQSAELAKQFLIKKFPHLVNGDVITGSDFTKATKHGRDQWVRNYVDQFMTKVVNGRAIEYTLI